MLYAIIAIVTGLMLLTDIIGARGRTDRLRARLRGTDTVLGLIALVTGIVAVLGGAALIGVVLILCGLVLAAGRLGRFGRVGDQLQGAGKTLAPFRVLLGLLALLIGLAAIL